MTLAPVLEKKKSSSEGDDEGEGEGPKGGGDAEEREGLEESMDGSGEGASMLEIPICRPKYDLNKN